MANRPPEVRALARRYFCCCVPVGVGSFVSSAVLGVLCLLMIIGIIFLLTDKKDIAVSVLPHDVKVGLAVVLVIFILVLLVAVLGVIGTIRKSRPLIQIYSWTVLAITISQAAGIGYLVYVIFIRKCKDEFVDGVEFQCVSIPESIKVLFLFLSLLLLGSQVYVAFVIRSYEKQLLDEQILHQEYMAYNGNAFNLHAVDMGRSAAGVRSYAKVPYDEEF